MEPDSNTGNSTNDLPTAAGQRKRKLHKSVLNFSKHDTVYYSKYAHPRLHVHSVLLVLTILIVNNINDKFVNWKLTKAPIILS